MLSGLFGGKFDRIIAAIKRISLQVPVGTAGRQETIKGFSLAYFPRIPQSD